MRFLSLFSGIEAASSAWDALGWECVAVAEIEPFPCALLKHRYPNIPNLGDVTKITKQQIEGLGHIDVVVFGAPCQDLSVAGKRKGLTNADGTFTRSGLFFTACDIADWSRARFSIWENTPGAYSTNEGRDFAAVVGRMAGTEVAVPRDGWRNAGVVLGRSGLVEWFTLDAQYVRVQSHPRAVPQRRRRVFVVRDSGDWQSRPPLFLEPASLCGNPAPSRKAGQRVAPTISARTKGGGGLGTDFDCDGGLVPHVCGCLSDGAHNGGGLTDKTLTPVESSRPGFERGVVCAATGQAATEILHECCPTLNCNHEQPYIAGHCREVASSLTTTYGRQPDGSDTALGPNLVAHSLRGEGFDASEDGTGRGTPIVAVAFSCKDSGQDAAEDVSPTLRSMNEGAGNANAGGQVAIAFDCKAGANTGFAIGDVPGALRGEGHGGGHAAVAFDMRGREGGAQFEGPHDTANIRAASGGSSKSYVAQPMAVRRLTPLECERLQGFPDGWTNIPIKGKPAKDGPRYKALGNSMATNVMRLIGERIQRAIDFSK